MQKIAIVTGGTGGIGLEVVRALAERGAKVYAFSRRAPEGFGFPHVACDVSDGGAVRRAVDGVLAAEGRIDILVNCAGFGISGAFECTDPADAKRLLDVNLFGMSHAIQAVLPAMRSQGAGRIVNVSSVAAVAPIPFQAWYSISKAAVNALTMAVASEVRPFGVTVCAAMPGDVRTGFTAAREKSALGDDVYAGRIARSVGRMERDEANGMSAAAVGRRVARLAWKRRVPPLTTLGLSYKACALMIRLLPSRTLRAVLAEMYAR